MHREHGASMATLAIWRPSHVLPRGASPTRRRFRRLSPAHSYLKEDCPAIAARCASIRELKAMAMDLELPLRGLAAGLIIAAPVGPVNLLCIRRTIEKGWRSGIVSGFGAALADTLYGAVAGFSLTLVIQFLIREEFWIRLIGGILLMAIGIVYCCTPPRSLKAGKDDSTANSDFVSALLLNVTNPTTALSFLAVLATLGLGKPRPLWQTSLLVVGIFCGSMTWWTILVSAVNLLRSRITNSTMHWMNYVGGIAIGGFGLVNVVLSLGHRH